MRLAHRSTCLALSLTGLALVSGCASRSPSQPRASVPSARQSLNAAHDAVRAGRLSEAQALYARAGHVDAPVEVRRDALLAHGLLVLNPTTPARDIDAARGLLSAARTLYEGPAPLELTAALALTDDLMQLREAVAMLERADTARTTAADTAEARARTLAAENQALARTVRQLRQDLERKDAALRKAADAVIGTPRSR
jgi:hypothetical protein